MWVWSKGLGQMVMPLSLDKTRIEVGREKMVIRGHIVAPKVNWQYNLAVRDQDLVDFMRLLNQRHVVEYLVSEGWIRNIGDLLKRALWVGLLYFWYEGKKLWSFSRRD